MASIKQLMLFVAVMHTQLFGVYSLDPHFISQCNVKEANNAPELTFDCSLDQTKDILHVFAQNVPVSCDNRPVELSSVKRVAFNKNCKYEYLPPALLSRFSGLENLIIEAVGIRELRENDFPIEGRHNLKLLRLSGNNLTTFNPASLTSLTSLKSLFLGSNEINAVHQFPALGQLELLHLDDNKITQISSDTFDQLPELKDLDLSTNLLKSAAINTNGRGKIESLGLSFNEINTIRATDFTGLVHLKKLFLIVCKVKIIEPKSFSALVNLEKLSLLNNQIAKIEPETFDGLAQLKDLDLSINKLKSAALHFNENNNLQILKMCVNKFDVLRENDFANLKQLEELEVMGSQVTRIELPALMVLEKLKKLDLSLNQLTQIEWGTFVSLSKLNTLLLGNNRLTAVDLFIPDDNQLHTVDLTGNEIEVLRVKDFKVLKELKELKLAELPLKNIELGAFSPLVKLEKLDLSRNTLDKVDFAGFLPSMPSLTTLKLIKNRLTELDANFDQMFPKLDELLITYNNFNCSYLGGFLQTLRKNPHAVNKNPSHDHNPNMRGVICIHATEQQPQPPTPPFMGGGEQEAQKVPHGFGSGYNVSIFVLLLWISFTNLIICGAIVLAARTASSG